MKNKKTILSIIIFFIAIFTLGIPFYNWGFKTDDWSNIYYCIANNFSDILNFFSLGNIEALCYPSNAPAISQNFLKGLFRPMSFVYYLPQYLLFKTNAFGYYLVTITLHAINSVIFFNILCYIAPLFLAFFSALLFAFHPSLWNWLGWISAQTYQTELFVLFLIIISLKKYIDLKKFKFYLISCLLFASNLFLKEQTIIFPVWIISAIFFYYKTQNEALTSLKSGDSRGITSKLHSSTALNPWFSAKTDKTKYGKPFILSIGYWIIAVFYLIIRAIQFPITSNCDTFNCKPNLVSFLSRTKKRLFDFVTYVSDFFFLSWMPNDHQIIKGSIIIFFISILTWLFIKNSKKPFIIFMLFSALLFSWPALLIQYQPRYIYISLIFFILALNILISFSIKQNKLNKHKKTISIILAMVIIFFASFLFVRLKQREHVLNHITTSFKKLTNNKKVLDQINNKKPLCLVALPPHWFGMSTAQAIWFLTNKDDYPVYEYGANIFEKNRNSYRQIPKFDKNYLKLTPTNSGIKVHTLNKDYLWFIKNNKKVKNLNIKIPQKYLDKNLLFITWDYEKSKFKLLNVKQ